MANNIQRNNVTIDATGKSLGRLASEISILLQGKHKPSYQKHLDDGDDVIVKNVQAVKITGEKAEQKIYYKASGYPGGIKATKLKDMLATNPKKMLTLSVRGMLPNNKLRPRMLKRLTIE